MSRGGAAAAAAGALVAAVAGLAQLALLFADWFTVAPTGPTGPTGSSALTAPATADGGGILNLLNTYDTGAAGASGWDVLGAPAMTPLLATVGLGLLLPVVRRVGYAAAALGVVTVVILVLRVVSLGGDAAGARVTVELPAYLGVICAAAIAAGAWAARPVRGT
jgi:hypothetical protein